MTRERFFPPRGSSYSKLFQDSSYGIFRADVSGRVIDLNPAFARMFGYDHPDQCIYLDLGFDQDLYAASHGKESGLEAFFEETGHGFIEKEFTRKDGTRFTGRVKIQAAALSTATASRDLPGTAYRSHGAFHHQASAAFPYASRPEGSDR